ncbi:MAG: OmpA family protein [Chitinophagales bacterium]
MRNLFFLQLLFLTLSLYCQNVQWCSEVVKFSTQYTRVQFSANQVIGKPNKLPAWGESAVAWAAATPDNPAGEFIHVRFAVPQRVAQIGVGESNCPGSIREIILFSVDGKKYSVYQNENIKPEFTTGGRIFRQFIPLTEYLVSEVKVVLNTKAIPGMNQIDCIGISDSETPIKAIINEADYVDELPEPENLGPMINSNADDMFGFISPDGKTLYFARKNYYENTGDELRDDIYLSTFDNGTWTKAVNIGSPLNNDQHNYVTWISSDGNNLLLSNNYEKIKQDISVSKKNNNEWTFPKALKINNFYNNNEFSCFHMNTEANVILMNIEREDTYGDMDIYMSMLQKNGVWSEPVNVGNTLNSAAKEGSVFIAADNKTVYFSSEGISGYGGFDMFMTKRLDDTWLHWSEPVNLGEKINSASDDFYYTIPASGDYAYFSSRETIYGKADLYRIKLPVILQPEMVKIMKGKIIDGETKMEMNADIEFGGLESDDPKGISTTTDGNYQVIIPEENYNITIKKKGYLPVEKNVDEHLDFEEMDYDEMDPVETIKHTIKTELRETIKTNPKTNEELLTEINERIAKELKDSTSLEKDKIVEEISDELMTTGDTLYSEVTENIEMIPIREGNIIRLNNIFFEANKADIKDESSTSLDEIVEFLKSNPNIYVEIGGHTNGLPPDDFCQRLSNNRAKNVVEYLISKGIKPDHITWKGYGKTQPIADNSSVAGRKQNQRVELKIIKVE